MPQHFSKALLTSTTALDNSFEFLPLDGGLRTRPAGRFPPSLLDNQTRSGRKTAMPSKARPMTFTRGSLRDASGLNGKSLAQGTNRDSLEKNEHATHTPLETPVRNGLALVAAAGYVVPISPTLPPRAGDVRGRNPAVDATTCVAVAAALSSNGVRTFRERFWDAGPAALLTELSECDGLARTGASDWS